MTTESIDQASPPVPAAARRAGRDHPIHVAASQQALFCPPVPTSMRAVGLPFSFLTDLLLKILYFNGNMVGRQLAQLACLPWPVTAEAVNFLTKENFIATTGARSQLQDADDFSEGLEYIVTGAGRERARETLELSQYAGPAPVPIQDYVASARALVANAVVVQADDLRKALGALVLPNEVIDVVGTALTARQAIFLYGPPGNGKSTIAEACAAVLGNPIFVPYALYVHGEVVRVFDPVHHRRVESAKVIHDLRWTMVHRPVVRTGGELRAQQLEPAFDRALGFYEAPLQIKANGGIFHVDDFGRQVITPREILNRLIVPLETGMDHLNIARAGTTVSVPYATILLLSTNLDPSELVDEAFLRRVRYKTLIPDPTPEAFRLIFQRICTSRGVHYDDQAVDYLISKHYEPVGRSLRGCQPRDLVDQLISTALYLGREPELQPDLIDRVAHAYFADFRYAAGLVGAPETAEA